MGSSKESGTTVVNQTTTPTPTAEETERNKILLEREKATSPAITRNILSGLDLSDLLLRGQNLPGYLSTLPGGISEDQTQSMVNKSLKDINPFFSQSNLLDSGVRASSMARAANDTRLQSATFNLGNLQQLLNLAVGGQAQPLQAPVSFGAQLGQSLAGLRSTNTSGTSTQTIKSMNPFFEKFSD